jgi:hypothetical protein
VPEVDFLPVCRRGRFSGFPPGVTDSQLHDIQLSAACARAALRFAFMADTNLSSFLWSVADLLRGDCKQSDYGKVIRMVAEPPAPYGVRG